jgi:hypothetical protein
MVAVIAEGSVLVSEGASIVEVVGVDENWSGGEDDSAVEVVSAAGDTLAGEAQATMIVSPAMPRTIRQSRALYNREIFMCYNSSKYYRATFDEEDSPTKSLAGK